jgi:hypothetical protein
MRRRSPDIPPPTPAEAKRLRQAAAVEALRAQLIPATAAEAEKRVKEREAMLRAAEKPRIRRGTGSTGPR